MCSVQLPMLAIIFHLLASSMAYCSLDEEADLDRAFLQDWIFQPLILLGCFNIHSSYSTHFHIEKFCMFVRFCSLFLALLIWRHYIENIRHHILIIIIDIDISCSLLQFFCLLIIVQLIGAQIGYSVQWREIALL